MDAFRLDARRASRSMLSVIAAMVVVQALLAVFAPEQAHARRWGGGYELRWTMYGYIVYCEEPVTLSFDPVYATREWRTTLYKGYGLDRAKGLRERDDLNLWFQAITDGYPTSFWLNRRCVSDANNTPRVDRRPWYYNGTDGTEVDAEYRSAGVK